MLLQSIHMQLKVIWERKVATIILFLLFSMMLVNYFQNIITFRGTDAIDMYHSMKLLTLSGSWSEYSYYLRQYYPLLVVIPAGFSLFSDKQLNQYIFIQSRVGARHYYLGKFIVVFIVTFFVFTIPFLIEIVLNSLAFPLIGVGDPSNLSSYDETYISWVNGYLFSSLYIYSPYLYAVVYTLIFGIVSGIFATFTVAVSTFSFKFKVLLFLPVYVLLYMVGMMKQVIPDVAVETNYFFYLAFHQPFRNPTANLLAFFSFCFFVFVLSLFIIFNKMRKDAL